MLITTLTSLPKYYQIRRVFLYLGTEEYYAIFTQFKFIIVVVTWFALADGWSLHFTSTRERQSNGLINGDSQRRSAAIKNWAKALWWGLNHTGKLWATWGRWGWWTSCYIVKTRAHACDCICATWLRTSFSPHKSCSHQNQS